MSAALEVHTRVESSGSSKSQQDNYSVMPLKNHSDYSESSTATTVTGFHPPVGAHILVFHGPHVSPAPFLTFFFEGTVLHDSECSSDLKQIRNSKLP